MTEFLSLAELAKHIEVNRRTVGDWVRDYNIPSTQNGSRQVFIKNTLDIIRVIKMVRSPEYNFPRHLIQQLTEEWLKDPGITEEHLLNKVREITPVNSKLPIIRDLVLPLLKLIERMPDCTHSDMISGIAKEFNLTDSQISIRTGSSETLFSKRIRNARMYLFRHSLVETKNGPKLFSITVLGKTILRDNPNQLSEDYLRTFLSKDVDDLLEHNLTEIHEQEINYSRVFDDDFSNEEFTDQEEEAEYLPPDDVIRKKYQEFEDGIAKEILHRVKSQHWSFLETLVLHLLKSMGYGDGKITGRTGDNGVDGFINSDELGLDRIVFQAKKWEYTVGEPEIRDFVGALEGKGVTKGIFFTTSRFSEPAKRYAESLQQKKVVLIDGERLGILMVKYNIGVSITETFSLKKVDSDYFEID